MTPVHGLCWPSPRQRLLLRALFCDGPDAARAFAAWERDLDLDTMDGGSLQLMPLLGSRLEHLNPAAPLLPRLRGARRYHWCRNQLMVPALTAAARGLRARGIPSVALKGLAVAPLYGDLGLRPMGDGDLLVPFQERELAQRELVRLGWHPRGRAARHGICFDKDGKELDLHWCSLLEDPRPDADAALFEGARPSSLLGEAVGVPTREPLLLHALVHGARYSRVQSVLWVPDAMHLLRDGTLNWDRLLDLVARRHFEVPILETLHFLQSELGAPVPEAVLAALRSRAHPLQWAEYACYAAEPRRVTSAQRAAARLVQRARAGKPVPPETRQPFA